MNRTTKNAVQNRRGSALILVVVVTMLLSVIGIVFIMTARLRSIAASVVTDSRDLDAAVQSVVSRMDTVLVQDLFGGDGRMINADTSNRGADEHYDYAIQPVSSAGIAKPWTDSIEAGPDGSYGTNDDVWLPGTLDDIWLASLEPVWLDNNGTPSNPDDDTYGWPQVTDLWGTLQGRPDSLYCQQYTNTNNPTFFTNTVGKMWVDPDADTNTLQLANWGKYGVSAYRVIAKIITPKERTKVILSGTTNWDALPPNTALYGARADADGDGVADSRWVIVPNLTTSGGKPVYAAVRIVDNCAMLNLNTAYCFYQDPYTTSATSPFLKSWFINKAARTIASYPSGSYYADGGRYLSEINYLPFLRGSDLNLEGTGGDGWYRILSAKGFCVIDGSDSLGYTLTGQLSTGEAHQVLMNIESPDDIPTAGMTYSLFNIGEELEIRNRFLLTSKVESRFERSDVANYTLDAGGGVYAVFETPVDDSTAFTSWKIKMNPANFDLWRQDGTLKVAADSDYADRYKYDRRHLCTFYSFDRNIRTAQTTFYTSLENQPNTIIRNTFLPEYKTAITTNIQNLNAALPETPYNNIETRRKILHLLYAFREYYLPNNFSSLAPQQQRIKRHEAAVKSTQIVANMIDYSDGNNAATQGPFFDVAYKSQADPNMTFIDRSIVRQMIWDVSGGAIDIGQTAPVFPNPLSPYEFGLGLSDTTTPPFETIYGYERQPFISEVYCRYNTDGGGSQAFALELINPYPTALNLQGWRIQIGAQNYPLDSSYASIPSGRLVIYNTGMTPPTSGTVKPYLGFGLGMPMTGSGNVLRLQRPDPANVGQFLTVDRITDNATDGIANGQREHLITNGIRVTKRQDTNWGFANLHAYVNDTTQTLGTANGVAVAGGYALPVPNNGLPIGRLADLESVAFIGNQNSGTDPNTITKLVSEVSNEAGVRFNMATASNMLDYVCTLNRDKGNLPGRININTAPKYVIAAAIPPNLVMSSTTDPNVLYIAGQIVANRPYTSLADLLTKVPAIKKFANNNPVIVGDTSISGDFEKRDWILSRLSNIFTVRSDTFTAYILVRLRADGPQRRMIAVFDRSNVWLPTDKPKLVALHPAPDPR